MSNARKKKGNYSGVVLTGRAAFALENLNITADVRRATAVKWEAQVETAFQCPAAVCILRIVVKMNM